MTSPANFSRCVFASGITFPQNKISCVAHIPLDEIDLSARIHFFQIVQFEWRGYTKYAARIQPRRWWRPSCRYLCCAARNPPSDDSQRHKSLVSHLSGTFLSPSLPSPSFSFARLRLLLAHSHSSLSFSRVALLLSSISPLAYSYPGPSSVTGSRPYISPTRHSFLSFHGHGGVSQEHRSEHNIDPAQPASAYHHNDLAALHRCWRFTVCVYNGRKFMDALRVISIVAILINWRTYLRWSELRAGISRDHRTLKRFLKRLYTRNYFQPTLPLSNTSLNSYFGISIDYKIVSFFYLQL